MEWIDPERFESDEAMLQHLLEEVVEPEIETRLSQLELEGDEPVVSVAYVFGAPLGVDQALVERVEARLVEGHDIEYVLGELVDLRVVKRRSLSRGDIHLHYIEFADPRSEPVRALTAEQLAELFAR